MAKEPSSRMKGLLGTFIINEQVRNLGFRKKPTEELDTLRKESVEKFFKGEIKMYWDTELGILVMEEIRDD